MINNTISTGAKRSIASFLELLVFIVTTHETQSFNV